MSVRKPCHLRGAGGGMAAGNHCNTGLGNQATRWAVILGWKSGQRMTMRHLRPIEIPGLLLHAAYPPTSLGPFPPSPSMCTPQGDEIVAPLLTSAFNSGKGHSPALFHHPNMSIACIGSFLPCPWTPPLSTSDRRLIRGQEWTNSYWIIIRLAVANPNAKG